MAPRVLPVCSVQVAVPTSSSLQWQDPGPEGQLGAKWTAGREGSTHPSRDLSLPSGGSSFELEVLVPLPLGKPERGSQGFHPPAAEVLSWTGGGPLGYPPWHSEGGVCWAGPPAWLFWSLPSLCQILASPKTSPKSLGGSLDPHFLPGEINQLSTRPDT